MYSEPMPAATMIHANGIELEVFQAGHGGVPLFCAMVGLSWHTVGGIKFQL